MRILVAALTALSLFLASSTSAAGPVAIEVLGVEEQPGKLTLSLSIVGADGKAATGLNASNFRVALNEIQASISSISSGVSQQPVSVLLLVDVSGSMQGEYIVQSRQALQEFVRGLDPSDQVAVMAFANSVTLLQDYTADRALLSNAITRLTPLGETALYNGVIDATSKVASAPPGRRIIVLLSDGTATINLNQRAASITAAREAGASFVALGLGSGIDKGYLSELATASKGRFLETPTTAAMREAYADLASAIRSQYTLNVDVPPGLDRTMASKLTINTTVRADSGILEQTLPPLAGAVPPPFDLRVTGINQAQVINAPATLEIAPPDGAKLVKVEYVLDGEVVHTSTVPPYTFDFDPAPFAVGNHTMKVVATDDRGSRGEAQVQFATAVPPTPTSIPFLPILGLLAILVIGGGGYLWHKKRPVRAENYETRLRPYSNRVEPNGPVEGWPEQAEQPVLAPPVPVVDRVLGRVVIMNEDAIRNGQLEGIREYEIKSTPLTLGSGNHVDIFIPDDGMDRIAAEEARLWVQRGRLVYHKLTTLSAMATEGVTSGWVFLDNGEELQLGVHRIVFQVEVPEVETPAEPDVTTFTRAQEHGMRLQPLWPRVDEDPSLPASSEQGL